MTKDNYEELFEQYSFIVQDVYKKLSKNTFIERYKEDIQQEGYLAIWKGINNFNKDYGSQLFSYLYACAKNAMLKFIETNQNKNFDISLDTVFENDDQSKYTMYDFMSTEDTDEIYFSMNLTDIIKCYEKWLTRNYKKYQSRRVPIDERLQQARIVLESILNENMSYRDIEERYGINRTICYNIIKNIRSAITT